MKIVVLAGGTSTERDVSIVSGTGVCRALQSKGHRALLMDVFFGLPEADVKTVFDCPPTADAAAEAIRACNSRLDEALKTRSCFFGPNVIAICQKADIVFLALHGANGEDGKVQAAFDLFGIPYTGTGYLSSAIAMDKGLTKQFFLANHVPTPRGCAVRDTETDITAAKLMLDFPVIVKPSCGGSSVGVTVAHTEAEFQLSLKEAFSYEHEVIVEEFIRGREFSVAVVDGEAYPIIEIAPKEGFYDYKNKYQAGSTVETCPAEIPDAQTKEMQRLAVLGAKVLGITGYCRLDFMMREDGRMYCLEANTLPGMTPTSLIPQEAAVLGISYPDLCEKLIALSLKK